MFLARNVPDRIEGDCSAERTRNKFDFSEVSPYQGYATAERSRLSETAPRKINPDRLVAERRQVSKNRYANSASEI
jgi:hypothetical protein